MIFCSPMPKDRFNQASTGALPDGGRQFKLADTRLSPWGLRLPRRHANSRFSGWSDMEPQQEEELATHRKWP